MALAVTLKASGSVGSASAATRSQALTAITFAADSIVMVALGGTQENYAAGWLSATATGLTFTERVTAEATGQFNTASRILTAPHSAGGSTIITVTTGATQCYTLSYAVYEITGHDTGSPFGATATYGPSATPADGAHSMTLSGAPAASSVVVGSVYVDTDTNHGGITEGTGWTEDADTYSATWYGNQQTQQRTGSTSTSVAWADLKLGSSAVYNVTSTALEIIAGAGGGTDATVTPSAVAATTSVPAPTVSTATNATVTPAAVAATASVPTASVSAGTSATVTPATIAATATIPSGPVSMGSQVTPATVVATAAFPAPTVGTSSGATVTPATIAATTAVPAPTFTSAATVTPATVTGVSTIPTPSVAVGGSATINASTVAATVTVPAPTVAAQSTATITPTPITATVTVPSPSVSGGSDVTIAPATIVAVTSVLNPGVSGGTSVNITPAALEAVATVQAPTVAAQLQALILPATIAALVTVPTPFVSQPPPTPASRTVVVPAQSRRVEVVT